MKIVLPKEKGRCSPFGKSTINKTKSALDENSFRRHLEARSIILEVQQTKFIRIFNAEHHQLSITRCDHNVQFVDMVRPNQGQHKRTACKEKHGGSVLGHRKKTCQTSFINYP
jgi:hypothetical protein